MKEPHHPVAKCMILTLKLSIDLHALCDKTLENHKSLFYSSTSRLTIVVQNLPLLFCSSSSKAKVPRIGERKAVRKIQTRGKLVLHQTWTRSPTLSRSNVHKGSYHEGGPLSRLQVTTESTCVKTCVVKWSAQNFLETWKSLLLLPCVYA